MLFEGDFKWSEAILHVGIAITKAVLLQILVLVKELKCLIVVEEFAHVEEVSPLTAVDCAEIGYP